MSTIDLRVPTGMGPQSPITNVIVRRVDDRRGSYGMQLFILTEAFLFVMLFTAYFYLAQGTWRWLEEKPPALHYAIPMLAILIAASGVLYWGQQAVNRESYGKGRIAFIITFVIGLAYLGLSAFDYKEHLQQVTPRTNAYGSIFYTITTLHVAHLCLGMFMLIYVLMLPKWEPRQWPPYRPYNNVAMYWHFVNIVWVFTVTFLYIAPNVR